MHEPCPCGTSNCTLWATQLAKATHSTAIYAESMKKTQPAGRAGSSFSLHGRSLLPGTHTAIPELWIQTIAQVQENENQRVSAESRWLRSLPYNQKPIPHLTVAATASRDPTKDRPVSVKYSQGSSKLLLLTKNSEFMHSSSQAKHIYQLKVTLIISNVA